MKLDMILLILLFSPNDTFFRKADSGRIEWISRVDGCNQYQSRNQLLNVGQDPGLVCTNFPNQPVIRYMAGNFLMPSTNLPIAINGLPIII